VSTGVFQHWGTTDCRSVRRHRQCGRRHEWRGVRAALSPPITSRRESRRGAFTQCRPRPETASSPEMQRAAATWDPGISPAFGRGGSVWAFMAYDSQLGLLYAGTGNPAPYKPSDRSPSGGHYDDLYTDCIIALHADTGKMAWYFQTTPGDAWDYDASAPLVLADLRIGGRERKVLMQGQQERVLLRVGPHLGAPISAKPFVRTLNWSTGLDHNFRPIVSANADYERGPKMIVPSNYGAHEWTPMAFSPLTGAGLHSGNRPAHHLRRPSRAIQAPRCTRSMAPIRSWAPRPSTRVGIRPSTGVFSGSCRIFPTAIARRPGRGREAVSKRGIRLRSALSGNGRRPRTTSF